MTRLSAVCICSHTALVHTHDRSGTDCALCPCQSFSRYGWLARLTDRIRGAK